MKIFQDFHFLKITNKQLNSSILLIGYIKSKYNFYFVLDENWLNMTYYIY